MIDQGKRNEENTRKSRDATYDTYHRRTIIQWPSTSNLDHLCPGCHREKKKTNGRDHSMAPPKIGFPVNVTKSMSVGPDSLLPPPSHWGGHQSGRGRGRTHFITKVFSDITAKSREQIMCEHTTDLSSKNGSRPLTLGEIR